MKRLLTAFFALGLVLAGSLAFGQVTSGALTMTVEGDPSQAGALSCWVFDWTCDSAGSLRATTTAPRGTVARVMFISDTGATSPTTAYDITALDVGEFDILQGHGANLVSTVTSHAVPLYGDHPTSQPVVFTGPIDLTVDNAGDTRGGILRIWARP